MGLFTVKCGNHGMKYSSQAALLSGTIKRVYMIYYFREGGISNIPHRGRERGGGGNF
jgi:hypothetical protein